MLQTVVQSGVTNYLIVALDVEVRDHLLSKGMNVYYHKVSSIVTLALSTPQGDRNSGLYCFKVGGG